MFARNIYPIGSPKGRVDAMEEYPEAGEGKSQDFVNRLSCVSWYLVSRCSAIATMLRSAMIRT